MALSPELQDPQRFHRELWEFQTWQVTCDPNSSGRDMTSWLTAASQRCATWRRHRNQHRPAPPVRGCGKVTCKCRVKFSAMEAVQVKRTWRRPKKCLRHLLGRKALQIAAELSLSEQWSCAAGLHLQNRHFSYRFNL